MRTIRPQVRTTGIYLRTKRTTTLVYVPSPLRLRPSCPARRGAIGGV